MNARTCLLTVAFLLAPLRARAQTPQTLYEEGVKHYNLAQYDEAIAKFEKAYLLTAAPELLYDIAQSYRLMGPSHCARALQFYRNYLRVSPTTSKRASVEAAIGDMERCSQTEPQSDAEPESATTTKAPPPASPAPAPPAVPQVARSTGAGLPGWLSPIVGGVGVALAGTGGALLVWARNDYVSIRDSGCAPWCQSSVVDGPRQRQTIGGALVITGGVVAATGVVLWLFRRGSTHVDAAAWLGTGAVGLRTGVVF